MIPEVRNRKSNHIRIDFEYEGKSIILLVDPNEPEVCNYKRIQALCNHMILNLKINHSTNL